MKTSTIVIAGAVGLVVIGGAAMALGGLRRSVKALIKPAQVKPGYTVLANCAGVSVHDQAQADAYATTEGTKAATFTVPTGDAWTAAAAAQLGFASACPAASYIGPFYRLVVLYVGGAVGAGKISEEYGKAILMIIADNAVKGGVDPQTLKDALQPVAPSPEPDLPKPKPTPTPTPTPDPAPKPNPDPNPWWQGPPWQTPGTYGGGTAQCPWWEWQSPKYVKGDNYVSFHGYGEFLDLTNRKGTGDNFIKVHWPNASPSWFEYILAAILGDPWNQFVYGWPVVTLADIESKGRDFYLPLLTAALNDKTWPTFAAIWNQGPAARGTGDSGPWIHVPYMTSLCKLLDTY